MTDGGRFRERNILSGNSRGLSRRRRRNEKCGESETTKAMTTGPSESKMRCRWAANELNIPYHDEEWGVPVHEEHAWFEFLILEGAQAGLGWETILTKPTRHRPGFSDSHPPTAPPHAKHKRLTPL